MLIIWILIIRIMRMARNVAVDIVPFVVVFKDYLPSCIGRRAVVWRRADIWRSGLFLLFLSKEL